MRTNCVVRRVQGLGCRVLDFGSRTNCHVEGCQQRGGGRLDVKGLQGDCGALSLRASKDSMSKLPCIPLRGIL